MDAQKVESVTVEDAVQQRGSVPISLRLLEANCAALEICYSDTMLVISVPAMAADSLPPNVATGWAMEQFVLAETAMPRRES